MVEIWPREKKVRRKGKEVVAGLPKAFWWSVRWLVAWGGEGKGIVLWLVEEVERLWKEKKKEWRENDDEEREEKETEV